MPVVLTASGGCGRSGVSAVPVPCTPSSAAWALCSSARAVSSASASRFRLAPVLPCVWPLPAACCFRPARRTASACCAAGTCSGLLCSSACCAPTSPGMLPCSAGCTTGESPSASAEGPVCCAGSCVNSCTAPLCSVMGFHEIAAPLMAAWDVSSCCCGSRHAAPAVWI